MKKQLANIITLFRIVCSIWLLLLPVFSMRFYVVYLFYGFTDMIDGPIARKTHSVTEFGSKLDSVADLIFVVVAFVKLLSVISLPNWLWVWITIIALIKVTNIVFGWISVKRLVIEHMLMNKITGFVLFLLPLTLSFIELKYSAVVVCAVAAISAIQEGKCIKVNDENRNKKRVSYLYRTATTQYPCLLPHLGDSRGAGRIRLTQAQR